MVCGFVCGKTDNDNGSGDHSLASVGFNCRLIYNQYPQFISSNSTPDSELYNIANAGALIINGSYTDNNEVNRSPNHHNFNPGLYVYGREQTVFQELYENNISPVFAAGNGWQDTSIYSPGPEDYRLPASLDYVLSISSVGWANTTGLWNLQDVHEWTKGASVYDRYNNNCHNHNSRVDLCAPGLQLESLTWDSHNPTTNLYNTSPGAWGTSFSAPIVSGTIGLMLSAKPCLSPYQREYILKHTAVNVDGVSGNSAYADLLGAGRLDAGAAVQMASTFDCNDKKTRTMVISNVEINSKCHPGYSYPAIIPQFYKVDIENGTPPYTYRWDSLAGTQVGLSCYNCANPYVSVYSTQFNWNLVRYRLTVTDASIPAKVASKIVEVTLTTNTVSDLAMKDGPHDQLIEPNNMEIVDKRDYDYWSSPDLWNRIHNDNGTTHEDTYYPDVDSTPINYISVHIRNVGCQPSSSNDQIHIYWAKASTGQSWPTKWINYSIAGVPYGKEITSSLNDTIPIINPGHDTILTFAWTTPKPSDYYGSDFHFCLLGRISDSTQTNLGMYAAEDTNVNKNTKNNNNIVMHNMFPFVRYPDVLNNYNPSSIMVDVSSFDHSSQFYDLQFMSEKMIQKHLSGDLSDVMYVKLELGDLFDIWQTNGGGGNYDGIDYTNKTVTFNAGGNPLMLNHIPIASSDLYHINFVFNPISSNIFDDIETKFFFHQLRNDTVIDGFDFNVKYLDSTRVDTSEGKHGSTQVIVHKNTDDNRYSLFPNPALQNLNIQFNGRTETKTTFILLNITGQELYRRDNFTMNSGQITNINIQNWPPGNYFVKIHDSNGLVETQRFTKLQ